MSTYDKETKFYWLQLKEDYFEDDTIQFLEDLDIKYSYFYIKLCLKSLKSNGILIRKVGSMLIPYDNEKIAELTRTDIKVVKMAMPILQKIGLVKLLDDGELYLSQVENLVGSTSKGAFKKQQQRLLKKQCELLEGGQMSTEVSTKDKDKVKVKDKTIIICDYVEENFGRGLTPIEFSKIEIWEKLYDLEVIKYAIELSVLNSKRNFSYIDAILRNWETNNLKTLQEVKDNQEQMKNKDTKKPTSNSLDMYEEIV